MVSVDIFIKLMPAPTTHFREPHQLVPLPREPSASHILNAFLEQKREKTSTTAMQLQRFQELIEGIRSVRCPGFSRKSTFQVPDPRMIG